MPEIKDYDGKRKKTKATQKRRPHHEMEEDAMMETTAEVVEDEASEELNTEALNEGVHLHSPEPGMERAEARATGEGMPEPEEDAIYVDDKVHLEFYGSEALRQKAPKVMELAETVADEWVKDGQFEGLPLGNPIAQMAAAKALRTAKSVEKKLDEKGVFAMARMGIDLVKSKIEKRQR